MGLNQLCHFKFYINFQKIKHLNKYFRLLSMHKVPYFKISFVSLRQLFTVLTWT